LNEIGTADNPLKVRLAEGESLGSSQWEDGDSDAIYYNDGNVGIGTSEPSEKLDIVGNLKLSGNVSTDGNPMQWIMGSSGQITFTTVSGGSVFRIRGSDFQASADLRFLGEQDIRFNGDKYAIAVKGTDLKIGVGADASTATKMTLNSSGDVGIGTTAPSAKLHTESTTEQLRLGYDTSNYVSTTVGSTGIVTHNAVGSASSFVFSDPVSVAGITTLTGTGGGKLLLQDTDTSGYTLCTALNGTLTCCTDDNADGTCD
jgi:hypothetical protein